MDIVWSFLHGSTRFTRWITTFLLQLSSTVYSMKRTDFGSRLTWHVRYDMPSFPSIRFRDSRKNRYLGFISTRRRYTPSAVRHDSRKRELMEVIQHESNLPDSSTLRVILHVSWVAVTVWCISAVHVRAETVFVSVRLSHQHRPTTNFSNYETSTQSAMLVCGRRRPHSSSECISTKHTEK